MKLEHSDKTAEPLQGENGHAPQTTRRKLIQTGLAGAPLLMALKSAPALAAECKQPSGFSASGNLSQNGTKPCAPKMNGIAYWRNYAEATPPLDDLLDNNTFGGLFTASSSRTETLRTVITGTNGSPDAVLERQITAAWLSATRGPSLFAPTVAVKMWNDGVMGGGYLPNPSVPSVVWHKAQVQAYLDYVLSV